MKIIHISTWDKRGGAAIAACRLHENMLKSGIDSKLFVLNRTIYGRNDIVQVSTYQYHIQRQINILLEWSFLKRISVKDSWNIDPFKYGIDISKHPELISSDIIYLHWTSRSFVNYHVLRRFLETGKPVFWFMHDMFPITGGCHYSYECREYYNGCNACFYCKKKFISRQFRIKSKIYKKYNNLTFIAPSKWLFECAKKSGLTFDKPICHIPNLIDDILFKTVEKKTVRKLLLISIDKKVICFGADSALTNPNKGWGYFRDTLLMLSKDDALKKFQIEILIFGSSYNKKIAADIPFQSRFLGPLYDEYTLVAAYNASDVFVIPSLAENFPQTVLESLTCNTPVVGFNVGGIPDMVNENTGYLAEYKNSVDLAKGISLMLRNPLGNVRKHIENFFTDVVLDKHKKMWNDRCL